MARFPADQGIETGAAPAAPALAPGGPNSSPLNMFPEVKLQILEGFYHVLAV